MRSTGRPPTACVDEDDRPIADRLTDSWDARTAGVGLALVASLWFWVYGAWAITGSEAKWAGYLLSAAGVDVAGVEYWGSVLFRGEGISVTIDMLMIAGVIVGSFLAAIFSGDFRIRWPKVNRLHNPVVGGFLMGVARGWRRGVTSRTCSAASRCSPSTRSSPARGSSSGRR